MIRITTAAVTPTAMPMGAESELEASWVALFEDDVVVAFVVSENMVVLPSFVVVAALVLMIVAAVYVN
jgi:hypothetical protein